MGIPHCGEDRGPLDQELLTGISSIDDATLRSEVGCRRDWLREAALASIGSATARIAASVLLDSYPLDGAEVRRRCDGIDLEECLDR
jgi:hypothetical protein